jgi:hypothetical protein
MSLPCTPVVKIRLGTGASFGDPLVLGDPLNGILGTNVLGTTAIQVVDVSSLVTQISVRHGRDRMFEEYLPSDAIIQFQDFTGDWDPTNTGSAYYPEVKPMRQLQIYTIYQGTTYPIYSGYIWSWDYDWADPSVDYALVTVQCVDAFRLLALANITSVTGAGNKDLPGTRINQILDEIDWPASARDIDTGDTELQNDHGEERTVLQALQTIEKSDLGALYIDHLGKVVYVDRASQASKAAGTPVYFDDIGTNVQYQDITVAYDDTELANEVTLTRYGGQPQTASDSASIDEYFLRSFSRSDLMMETNATALIRAGQILNYRKDVRLRIESLTLDLSQDQDRIEAGLSLEIGDPIVVRKNMAGGSHIDARLTVQGHSHDITPSRWVTRLTTAQPLSTAFILGSTEFGVLGTSTL